MAFSNNSEVRLDVSGKDIVALDDEALVRFVRGIRPTNGENVYVDITKEVAAMPEDEKQRFIKRLSNLFSTARSVDLDEVSARLQQLASASDNSDHLLQPLRSPDDVYPPITPPAERQGRDKAFEAWCYHQLVARGGRPLYPIGDQDQIMRDPEGHAPMLSTWVEPPIDEDSWKVFDEQFYQWTSFKIRQIANRAPTDWDAAFSIHYDYQMAISKHSDETEDGRTPDMIRRLRNSMIEQWTSERGVFGDTELPGYTEKVKSRLAQCGFPVPAGLHLSQDPNQQDKLSTWVEYLYFECCEYDGQQPEEKKDRLQWIANEIPKVQAELQEMESEETESPKDAEANGTSQQVDSDTPLLPSPKRKQSGDRLDGSDDGDDNPKPAKKRRTQASRTPSASSKKAEAVQVTSSAPSTNTAQAVPPTAPPLRRSARLAAKQTAAQAAEEVSSPAKKRAGRARPTKKVQPAQKPPPPPKLQKTKGRKKGRKPGTRRKGTAKKR